MIFRAMRTAVSTSQGRAIMLSLQTLTSPDPQDQNCVMDESRTMTVDEKAARRRVLDELVCESERLGFYDDPPPPPSLFPRVSFTD